MSNERANFRVDYSDGGAPSTLHETEEDARKSAFDFVNAGPPDTRRIASVSRPVAVYHVQHSVSSIEYTTPSADNPPDIYIGEVATEEESILSIPDGYMHWGYEDHMPCEDTRVVEIVKRDGKKERGFAGAFKWGYLNDGADIVAYKLIRVGDFLPPTDEPILKLDASKWKEGADEGGIELDAKNLYTTTYEMRLGWNAHHIGWSYDDLPSGVSQADRDWKTGWRAREDWTHKTDTQTQAELALAREVLKATSIPDEPDIFETPPADILDEIPHDPLTEEERMQADRMSVGDEE